MSAPLTFTLITVGLVIFGAIQWARVDWLKAEIRQFLYAWGDRSKYHFSDRELMASVRRLRKTVEEKSQ